MDEYESFMDYDAYIKQKRDEYGIDLMLPSEFVFSKIAEEDTLYIPADIKGDYMITVDDYNSVGYNMTYYEDYKVADKAFMRKISDMTREFNKATEDENCVGNFMIELCKIENIDDKRIPIVIASYERGYEL